MAQNFMIAPTTITEKDRAVLAGRLGIAVKIEPTDAPVMRALEETNSAPAIHAPTSVGVTGLVDGASASAPTAHLAAGASASAPTAPPAVPPVASAHHAPANATRRRNVMNIPKLPNPFTWIIGKLVACFKVISNLNKFYLGAALFAVLATVLVWLYFGVVGPRALAYTYESEGMFEVTVVNKTYSDPCQNNDAYGRAVAQLAPICKQKRVDAVVGTDKILGFKSIYSAFIGQYGSENEKQAAHGEIKDIEVVNYHYTKQQYNFDSLAADVSICYSNLATLNQTYQECLAKGFTTRTITINKIAASEAIRNSVCLFHAACSIYVGDLCNVGENLRNMGFMPTVIDEMREYYTSLTNCDLACSEVIRSYNADIMKKEDIDRGLQHLEKGRILKFY